MPFTFVHLNTGESEVTEAVIQESEAQAQHARLFLEDVRLSFPQVNQVADFYIVSCSRFSPLNYSYLHWDFGKPEVLYKSVIRIMEDWLITHRKPY